VLDALDLVKEQSPQMRPRLEHAQIMKKEDAERVGKLGGRSCSLLFSLSIV
jgi:predicted amidohydrolase YtcJ